MSEKKTRILVVEDEDLLLELLTKTLQTSGYEVLTAKNGVDALELAIENEVDLILLDVMMPRMNGFTFCEEVRKLSDVPIIMLTALNRPDDVARGLQLGADEYITKPFSFRELNVRIQSILRRVSWNKGPNNFSVLSIDDIVLNVIDEKVTVRNQEVELTPMEYKLLHYLMMRPTSRSIMIRCCEMCGSMKEAKALRLFSRWSGGCALKLRTNPQIPNMLFPYGV
ncbi:MAG: response regulator transcription factor [Caldilineaceae bacterium]|nr:response regulator transcription factor [Caldilineaceae bacterium]